MNIIIILHIVAFSYSYPIEYKFYSGHLKYDETITQRSALVPHIDRPIAIYGLDAVVLEGYFSYRSKYHIESRVESDNFSLTVSIGIVYHYDIRINYAIMEEMPFMDYKVFNLTGSQQPTFNSKKIIQYDTDIQVLAFPIGFSSSLSTRQTMYYPYKQNNSYTLFVNMDLKQPFWIEIIFMILKKNYNQDNVICIGSHVHSKSSLSNKLSPLKIQMNDELKYIFALQIIFLPAADFEFHQQINQIYMNSTGAYSFNIIYFNTTCIYVFSKQYITSVRNEKIYLSLMLLFIIAFTVLLAILIWRICQDKKNKIEVQVSQDLRSLNKNQQVRQANQYNVVINPQPSDIINHEPNSSNQQVQTN